MPFRSVEATKIGKRDLRISRIDTTSFRSLPFRSLPFRSLPFRSLPFHFQRRFRPFRSLPFRSLPFRSLPFRFQPRPKPGCPITLLTIIRFFSKISFDDHRISERVLRRRDLLYVVVNQSNI